MQTIIFFDLDSTLVENRFSRKAIVPLLQEIADATDQTLETIGTEMGNENWRRQLEDPDNPLTMDWDDIIQTIAQRHNVSLSRSVLAGWQQFAHADAVTVLDNAPDVLQRLQQAGCKVILATKGLSKYQLPVLDAIGIRHLFDEILTPDLTGYLKTSPGYFASYAQQRDKYRLIQVGDHYFDDVICAKRNGFYAILRAPVEAMRQASAYERAATVYQYTEYIPSYPAEGTAVRPDAIVLSLQEVPAIVAALETDYKSV
jgi:putative hydrolase of the HAD superfamily